MSQSLLEIDMSGRIASLPCYVNSLAQTRRMTVLIYAEI